MPARKQRSLKQVDKKYKRAMRRALDGKPFLHPDGKYLSREQAHDRERFRDTK